MTKHFLIDDSAIQNLKTDFVRTGLSVSDLKQAISENLLYIQGKHPERATYYDLYMAVAYCVRDRLMHRSLNLTDVLLKNDFRVVCYLSAEYLLGPQLGNNLINLGIYEQMKEAIESLGLKLDTLLEQEPEPGLGNGGLGRLAACYLDSLATLEYPAIGYGIRYEFGMFEQEIVNGWQKERTDKWLSLINPWEIPRPEAFLEVKLGGRVESYVDSKGATRRRWIAARSVKGIPYDTPTLGFEVNNCNILRLWKAEAIESFDFEAFNLGDYYKAVEAKMFSETITKILYPNDAAMKGRQLRLEQQYFFISCALQDLLRIHLFKGKNLQDFHKSFAMQLNDTHPTLAIPELMRLLIDEYFLDWKTAWDITTKTFAYTNHTLLPEALEKWSIGLFGWILPRHLEIIYEINHHFLKDVEAQFPGDVDRLRRMSLIDETGERYIRMAHLACVGSHTVNGVAELHTKLLKEQLFPDFVDLWPEKFLNITNGVTPRRFLLLSNPFLSQLITKKIGRGWITNLYELQKLSDFAKDPEFQKDWQKVKLNNKKALAALIVERTGIAINPSHLFDVMIKRFHEYKRQHLNVLHILTLYNRLKKGKMASCTPRVFIFSGKAAPGYFLAKLIIKLINSVAEKINQDKDTQDLLKIVFFPNYNVKNAQMIFPAADLSEQISTAGKEASGTGNMKLSMNGAITVGTLDGANIEIRDQVGKENFFSFGLSVEEISALRKKGYNPRDICLKNSELNEIIEQLKSGVFLNGDKNLFTPLIDNLLNVDPYMVLADYESYLSIQNQVGMAYQSPTLWTEMSILNTAKMGRFSSDRAIHEYGQKIWNTKSLKITDKELAR